MSRFQLTRREALRASLGAAGAAGAAAIAGCATTSASGPLTAADFNHGVASGDPRADRVIIWTRATPRDDMAAEARVRWVVARDAGLSDIVRQGVIRTDASVDFTVKVDVDGLEPGRSYHYGFFAAGAQSTVGRTATLPPSGVERLTIAAVSCSNFPFGYFHAYQHLADRGDVDFVVALGDYIYEYGGEGSWGQEIGEGLGRAHAPPHELITLDDYRARHAQYKTDPGLQAAHAAVPWICSWDDHEIANNPWTDGAQNHNPENGEGTWEDRKAAALRAYFEWLPVREPVALRAPEALWGAYHLGGLVRLMMFETRLSGRVEQLTYYRDLASLEDADVAAFLTRLNAFDRRMISADQERFVNLSAEGAAASGEPWVLFGNQVIFARQASVNLVEAYDEATLAAMAEGSPWVAGQIERSTLGLPVNLDAWDGYPAQRDRMSDAFYDSGASVVMVTGDTHAFWANELYDTRARRYGAEFGTTGITSPGFGRNYAGLEPDIHDLIVAANREIRYANGLVQGYLSVTFEEGAAACSMFAVSDVTDPEATVSEIKRWRVARRADGAQMAPIEELPVA